MEGTRCVKQVAAASGATSVTVDLGGGKPIGFDCDGDLTATTFCFKAAPTVGGTHRPFYTDNGAAVTVPVGADRYVGVWTDDWKGPRELTIYFDSISSPVALTADTVIGIIVEV